MPRIHLDHLNGSPLLPQAASALAGCMGVLANPSAPYAEGRGAARLLAQARARVAALVGARPEEIVFTSSGTESNAWALTGLAASQAAKGKQILLSAVEHFSLLQTARRMEKEGWEVTVVPVDSTGRVNLARMEQALTPRTVLASFQWANAEVGTLQPVAELAAFLKARGILFHTDAVAAAGRVPVDVRRVPVDALSLAAHPLGGPPGIAALYIRKGVRIQPLFAGGTQEEGRRAGTENLPGAAGMGAAAEAAVRRLNELPGRLNPLQDRLFRGILELIPEAVLNGHPTERLPGHASVSFPGVDAEALVLSLDMQGVAVGLGSVCTVQTRKPSHVLKAMGADDRRALGTVVFSLGWDATEREIDQALEALRRAVRNEVTSSR